MSVELVDELIQSHLDTIEMALGDPSDRDWLSHVAYLQDLVRYATSALAWSSGPWPSSAEP
jgi:hypothetical protein